jgi:hypothetical protein
MLKTQTYVSENFFFQITKTIFLHLGISCRFVPQLKLFFLNKVHLLYHVMNYTNPENGLKIDHLDHTINSPATSILFILQTTTLKRTN